MKKLIVLVLAAAATVAATPAAEARDRGYHRGHSGYRHSHCAPPRWVARPVCPPPVYCPPPVVYVPRYRAPRYVHPAACGVRRGWVQPGVHFSFGYSSGPVPRW